MYLSHLKLWNFRKFGSGTFDLTKPDLDIPFQPGLNAIIGLNDSGKTAVIDAIKIVLKTHSYEWNRITTDDFYNNSGRLRIECYFEDLADEEAKFFIEWLGMKEEKPFLRIILDVNQANNRVLAYDIKAGVDDEGSVLVGEAREYLKCTYLKPLRDAKSELIPRKNSRLSQILLAHDVFKQISGVEHELEKEFKKLNEKLEKYFQLQTENGNEIHKIICDLLEKFFGKKHTAKFSATEKNIKSILEILALGLEDQNQGLGSHNLLFMAAELLHLDRTNWHGLRLGLVEELEAHLHPQTQLRIIESLQDKIDEALEKEPSRTIQLIITTHSPNLASKIKVNNILLCQPYLENSVEKTAIFPLWENTKLNDPDCKFLERFLDVTKANLFFANGVILVEGWAEELLLPVLAKKLDLNLTQKGVSVVNVGSTAFLRYCKIFQRSTDPAMKVPVAVITDVDVRPDGTRTDSTNNDVSIELTPDEISEKIIDNATKKNQLFTDGPVKTFVSPYWTLEYCIALEPTLRKLLYKAVLTALYDQKFSKGVRASTLENYKDAYQQNNLDTYFDNWTLPDVDIAFSIYSQILGKEKIQDLCKVEISKSILAQHLAEILDNEEEIVISDESPINYLVEAIKYAASGNPDNI